MMVSFRTTKFKDKVYTSGLMVRFIRETGNSLRCMGKEHISFQMEQNMMVFIIWENDMGKVQYSIPINSSTKVTGYQGLIPVYQRKKKTLINSIQKERVNLQTKQLYKK